MYLNLIAIKELTASQIIDIFRLADQLHHFKGSKPLKGKTFALFFPESSLRTRITFEKGIKELGGESILFPPESLDKKEELEDVIQYMENWVDGVIVRHSDTTTVQELAKYTSIPIINAMTAHNHPCEILSDLYAISKIRKNYRELTYTFIGPVSNIARSWMEIAHVMNLDYQHVCKKGCELAGATSNYKFDTNLEVALASSDIVLTDSLPADFRTVEYINTYQITLARMKLAKPNALLNPCPPFFRNEEVSEEVISSEYFVGYEFKNSLITVQQAIILKCMGITASEILLKLALYK